MDTVLAESADHLIWLLEGKNKPITRLCTEQTQVTYGDLKKLFDRVLDCAYWRQDATSVSSSSSSTDQQATTSVLEQPSQVEPQHQQHQPNEQETLAHTEQLNTNVYNQQNTSDDYVMVSSNDFADQSNQTGKQQQSKAYFSTLNQTTDNRNNINEFLNQNNDEGINFLQDSEIQTRTQQVPQQDTLENIENYQGEQQTFDSSNQEFKNDTHSKEFGQQPPNGYRGGYQKGRYSDERRGGHSGPRQHNGPRPNNSNWSNSRGGGSGANSGSRGGYRPRGGAGGNREGYRQPQPQQQHHQQVVQ
jgi:hypothetical protein